MLKMSSTRLHVLSQLLSKTRGKLCFAEKFSILSSVQLFIHSETDLLRMMLSKKLRVSLHRHDICRSGFKSAELGGHCLRSNECCASS